MPDDRRSLRRQREVIHPTRHGTVCDIWISETPASTGRHSVELSSFFRTRRPSQPEKVFFLKMSNPLISADEISDDRIDTTAGGISGGQQLFAEMAELGDGDGTSTDPKPMSKKAMKRAAKAERIAAMKLERRAREKEAKKEKKRILAEKRAAGELNDDDEEETRRRAKRAKIDFAGKVVVDLGFDEMMSDKVSSAQSHIQPVLSVSPHMPISRRSNLCVPSWHIHIVPIARHRTRLPCFLPPSAVRHTTDCKHSVMRATSGGPTPTGIQTVMRACGCATQTLRKRWGVWIPTKMTIQRRQQVHRQ